MANLIVNAPRKFQGPIRKASFDVAANLEVFAGSFMMAGTGGILNSTGAAIDPIGFALGHADNRTAAPSGGAARAIQVECCIEGYVWLSVDNGAAWTYDDIGLQVYNDVDGNTFNTTLTTNTKVGIVVGVDAAVLGAADEEEVLVYWNQALSQYLT